MGKLELRLCGELCGIIDEPLMLLTSPSKICIDNSLAKFISLLVQIYLAVLAIANSFRKLCLTAKEIQVARHELDEYETKINSERECLIFPYK